MKKIKISKTDRSNFLLFLYFGKSNDYLDNCINRAYRDFNRTLHGFSKLENKDEIYSEAKEYLRKSLLNLSSDKSIDSQDSFDDWHKRLCEELRVLFDSYSYKTLFIGQSQKWINMTLKYIYMFHKKNSGFENLFQFSHIPIDNIILSKLDYKDLTSAWSRINNYEEYFKVQKHVREVAANQKMTAFEFEFKLFMD